jgi:radical SAM superfamily enzyme YgiQ (UPF0313 family)
MKKTKIGLIQINTQFDGQVYLPLSIGYLKSYVKKHSKHVSEFEFAPFVYKRMRIVDALSVLEDCDVVAFSIYVWNEQMSLEIARQFKSQNLNRKSLIVFGGPQVPDNAERFLRTNTFVDIVVHNEGEESFKEICEEHHAGRLPRDLPNTSYLLDDSYVKVPNRSRVISLDEVPSPFLEGEFDSLLGENDGMDFLGLWESNRGCPFQCTFCDWGSATAAKVNKFGLSRLKSELVWFAKNQIEFIFVCDANFGLLPRDEEIAEHVAHLKTQFGYPQAFSVQSTKNVKERAFRVQKRLTDAGLSKGVTLSMQSMSPTTLQLIKRDNISLETYIDLQERFHAAGVLTYTDFILGLPGETLESWKRGISRLIDSGQHNRIQFNNLSLLPNAEMSTPLQRKLHGFETVKSEIVNVHGGGIDDFGEVKEWQELVIATNTLSREDWVRARSYAWWVAICYFDKLFFLPIVMFASRAKLGVGDALEHFLDALTSSETLRWKTVRSLNQQFLSHAASIQNGGVEYKYSRDWLDVYWPADEFAFIWLVANHELENLYSCVGEVISSLGKQFGFGTEDSEIILDSLKLNRNLLRLPWNVEGQSLELKLTDLDRKVILEFATKLHGYSIGSNLEIPRLIPKANLNFETWLREVVWYGHRTGSYVYKFYSVDADSVEPTSFESKEFAGHFG